jgi:hypothetical protein
MRYIIYVGEEHMKITLVVDTEDERGIEDSWKIVSHFYKRQQHRPVYTSMEVKYSKIPFIKMLRHFAKEARIGEEQGMDTSSLRFAKSYADAIFTEIKGL